MHTAVAKSKCKNEIEMKYHHSYFGPVDIASLDRLPIPNRKSQNMSLAVRMWDWALTHTATISNQGKLRATLFGDVLYIGLPRVRIKMSKQQAICCHLSPLLIILRGNSSVSGHSAPVENYFKIRIHACPISQLGFLILILILDIKIGAYKWIFNIASVVCLKYAYLFICPNYPL